MKHLLIITAVLCAACTPNCESSAADPVEYVNPLAGTLSVHKFSTGNTYPAIARPRGMNF